MLQTATRVAVAATLAAAGLAGLPARPAGAAAQPLTVVAVGDSYASGEGAIGAGWTNAPCHRSSLAGPENAANQLNAVRSTSFTSRACTGATTATLSGPGGQLSSLPSGRVDALTMSIGGNDIGFAGIVAACMAPVLDCALLDPVVTSDITNVLPGRLDAVLAAVPANVTNVFVTEYPDPTTGIGGLPCGSPLSPAFQGFDGITATEALWASNRVVGPLNAALAAAVGRANALPAPRPEFHFVSGVSNRFFTHGYCTGGGSPAFWTWPNPRFISTPVDSLTSQGDHMGTLHPNDLGQQAIGGALFDAMRFLLDPVQVGVTTPAVPVAGVPTAVTVTVTNTAGKPVPGAVVTIDGATAGTTGPGGTLSTTWTFGAAGNRTVTADPNPYDAGSTTIAVAGQDYVASSNPSPIPLGTVAQLALRADDTATNQLVAGTFTVASPSGTFTVPSGGSVANVTLSDQRRSIRVCEGDGPRGKPVCWTETLVTCPTITFQPALAVYTPRDVSELVDCVPSP